MGSGEDNETSKWRKRWDALLQSLSAAWQGFSRRVLKLATGREGNQGLERLFIAVFSIAIIVAFVSLGRALWGDWEPFDGALGNPERLLRKAKATRDKSEILRNLFFAGAGLVGAVAGLFQLYNSARRTRINEEQADTAFQAERNDRFVKASELLKSESEAVQIAGIYALQRLAEEPYANYRKAVVRVLAGFVRTNTGPEGRAQRAITQLQQAAKVLETGGASLSDDSKSATEERPSEAVNAAIDALMTLTDPKAGGDGLGHLVDLRRCRLVGLDQPGRQMIRWRLDGADFTGADLSGTDCREADLIEAILAKANLDEAIFDKADMRGADLKGARLNNARLKKTTLKSLFDESGNPKRSSLIEVFLVGANLSDADLRGANFISSTLRGTDLKGSDLRGAKLGHSDLANTDLLDTRNLNTEQLAEAWNVTWPDNVPRPETGPYAAALKGEDAPAPTAAEASDQDAT